jgi:hypothetical protein
MLMPAYDKYCYVLLTVPGCLLPMRCYCSACRAVRLLRGIQQSSLSKSKASCSAYEEKPAVQDRAYPTV